MPPRQNLPALSTICQLALAGYLLALLIGTHLPSGTPILPGDNYDKLCHFSAYAILAALVATAWQLTAGTLTLRHLRWTWIAVAVFGALDELTQIPVGRDCDFWDWVTDASGAAIGLLLFVCLRQWIVTWKAPHEL